MELLIEIIEAGKQSSLKMKNVSNESEQAIIRGFFEAVKGEEGVFKTKPLTPKEGKPPSPKQLKIVRNETSKWNPGEPPEVEILIPMAKIERVEEVPKENLQKKFRQLPLIGSSERGSASISDLVSDKEPQTDEVTIPDFWESGIKTDADGTKRYKCRYWCGCGKKANHYILLDTYFVSCHECDNEMDVNFATTEVDSDGVPGRDEYGNFFIAKSY